MTADTMTCLGCGATYGWDDDHQCPAVEIDAATLLAKLDQALRLLTEAQKREPRPGVEMAIAAIESARDHLVGKKGN